METQTHGQTNGIAARPPTDVGHRGLVEGWPGHTPKLNAALAKAQGEFPTIPRNRTVSVTTRDGGTYTFAYATLDAILDATRPALSKHGLALNWRITGGPRNLHVITVLSHESGEETTCDLEPASPITKNQELVSATTYLRRVGAQAILGVAADEDDDGNESDGNTITQKQDRPPRAAAGARQPPRAAAPKPHRHPDDTGEAAPDADWQRIKDMLIGAKPKGLAMPQPAAQEWLLARFGVEGPGDLTLAQCRAAETLLLAKQTGEKAYREILAGLVKDGWVRDDGQAEAAS